MLTSQITSKILSGNIPFGIYEGKFGGHELIVNGFNESALDDKEYILELEEGIKPMHLPVIINVKNNEQCEKIIELTFKE